MASKLQAVWEAQLGATVLWAPVALTLGICTYFALPQEPAILHASFFATVALLLFSKARGLMGMLLLAILLSGFALAKIRARTGWACDGRSCRSEIKGKVIGYFLDGEGTQPSCAGFDVIIAAHPLRGTCKSVPTRIDRFDGWRMGSHAIAINDNNLGLTTARGLSGNRPWVVVPEPRRKIGLTR